MVDIIICYDKMISLESIFDYAGSNVAQRNYVEGSRVLQAKHIIKCGKLANTNSGYTHVKALCLQTTNLKEKPHEINLEIDKSNKIVSCKCSCKAGLSGKCKHSIATLLHCHNLGDNIEVFSCTDYTCNWKKYQDKTLENYEPLPLDAHDCFVDASKKNKTSANEKTNLDHLNNNVLREVNSQNLNSSKLDVLDSDIQSEINNLFIKNLPNSALVKCIIGRHSMIDPNQINKVTDDDIKIYKILFQKQLNSKIMEEVYQLDLNYNLQQCCVDNLEKLKVDYLNVCVNTREWYAEWIKERKNRITGSTCYALYTYSKNKGADWDKKSEKYFTPSNFKTEAMKYGSEKEDEARNVFKSDHQDYTVIETGLIINQTNPWLAYSPDGILVKDNEPVALLEIKCPIKGKKENLEATVESQINKCLVRKDENIIMKCKHKYYGQIQLGMAVLNLPKT